MRLKIFVLILPVIIAAACLRTYGQSGSLGDPVYTYNFGAGPNPGPPLSAQFTNMVYTSGCPGDGEYTIISSLTNSNNCHTDTWQNLPTDHTGDPNGYMMLVNASFSPSVFFTAPVDVSYLCPNTTYRFTAYIVNLIKQSAGAGFIEPNITFTVTTTDGTHLEILPNSTGNIPSNADGASPWAQYGVTFTTPANLSSVIVTMTNNAPGGTGNDLVLDDISVRAYGPAITPGFNHTSSANPPLICAGEDADFTVDATIQPGVFTNPKYQWQQYDAATSSWMDIPGETNLSMARHFHPALPGNYQYRMAAADGSNILSPNCRIYSESLLETVYAKAVVTGIPVASPPLCVGQTLTLTAGGGNSYKWTRPDNTTSTDNPLVIPNVSTANAGNYLVTAFNENGCPSLPVNTQVTINTLPVAAASTLGSNTICEGTTAVLQATGGISYSWSPGTTLSDPTAADPTASPADTTTYTVTVTNAGGCTDMASVTLNVLKKPVADAGTDKVIFEGQSVKLTATAQYGNVYSWTPADHLSDPNVLNPIAFPVDNTTYTLKVTSDINCGSDTSSVFVKVYKKIIIPNTFSPNNDGRNDYWNIDALITYPQSVMDVFNRNGQLVYHSIGYSKPWDGKYNGRVLPPGTYYYMLDLKNSTPKLSGWVVLVR